MVNPVFLIALTLSVVAGSVTYIRKGQRDEVANRAQLLRSGPVIIEQSDPATASPVVAASANADEPTSAETGQPPTEAATVPAPEGAASSASIAGPTNSVPAKMLASALESENATPSPTGDSASTTVGARKDRAVNAVIYYAEVNRQALEQMAEESQGSGQFTDFGEFKAGPLLDVAKRLERKSGVRVLQKVSRAFDSKHLQQQWFVGTKTTDNNEIGITTLIVLDTSVQGRIRGEIELLKSFPEPSPDGVNLRKTSSPAMNFDIPNKYGMMVHMALPRQIAKDGDEILGPEGIMQIFESTAFKNQSSEFTLFVDFDTSPP
jgi:hypothetical protein